MIGTVILFGNNTAFETIVRTKDFLMSPVESKLKKYYLMDYFMFLLLTCFLCLIQHCLLIFSTDG